MNRKALILDAGGVLVHPLHGDWNIPARYRELLGAYARDIPGEAFRAACRAEAALLREDISIADIGVEYEKRLQFLKNVAARMGWVNYDKLRSWRKFVFFGIFVFAAILTPPDIVSQVMLGVPMYLLFEVGVQVSRFTKARQDAMLSEGRGD